MSYNYAPTTFVVDVAVDDGRDCYLFNVAVFGGCHTDGTVKPSTQATIRRAVEKLGYTFVAQAPEGALLVDNDGRDYDNRIQVTAPFERHTERVRDVYLDDDEEPRATIRA
jgi:hypothetical protein